ncbi:MAG TPA: isoprenyl transferase [Candidatus Omnitrophota bacterium]|nr:isoprenyl transferase [Candidatus Omnitrophota bacterium]
MVPKHVAFIMDGNGRWAKRRGLARIEGHRRGLKRIREALTFALDSGIKYLTFYAFSTENWKRPKEEVDFLMKACEKFIGDELAGLIKNNVRFRHIGRLAELPGSLCSQIERATELTKNNTRLCVQLAFNYGSRAEIIDAVKALSTKVKEGVLNIGDIDEKVISEALYTKDIPDPDLLIRTSGEMRVSNFLLWQLCYTEFYVIKKYWPDFDRREFLRAIKEFKKRSRRFGDIDE